MLTLVLAAFFIGGGIVDIAVALKHCPEDASGWMALSGTVTAGLGILVLSQWPAIGAHLAGIFVGARMLTRSWMLLAVGIAGHERLTHFQDKRIEMLERRVSPGGAPGSKHDVNTKCLPEQDEGGVDNGHLACGSGWMMNREAKRR
jgi:hypothetical protein